MINPVKIRDMKALAAYQEELGRNPNLRYIYFELTDKCNLRYLHCGSSCEPSKGQILPYTAIIKTLQSTSSEYCPQDVMTCLTGGEPLLHPDLDQIIHAAHSMGFPVGMTTNGTLIYG